MPEVTYPVAGFPWANAAADVVICVPRRRRFVLGAVDLNPAPGLPSTGSKRVQVFPITPGGGTRKAVAALRLGEKVCWQCGHPAYPYKIADGCCPECKGQFDP